MAGLLTLGRKESKARGYEDLEFLDGKDDILLLSLEERIYTLHFLCEVQFETDWKMVTNAREENSVSWRVTSVGRDRYGSIYWLFDDSRMYREAVDIRDVISDETTIADIRNGYAIDHSNQSETIPRAIGSVSSSSIIDNSLPMLSNNVSASNIPSISQSSSQCQLPSISFLVNEPPKIPLPASQPVTHKPVVNSTESELVLKNELEHASALASMAENSTEVADEMPKLKFKVKVALPVLSPPTKSWEIVCKTKQEWMHFPLLFQDSEVDSEAMFYAYLMSLVPLIILDIDVIYSC